MQKIIVPGKAGYSIGETINYPPYGKVRVTRVNLPGNMMEVEILV